MCYCSCIMVLQTKVKRVETVWNLLKMKNIFYVFKARVTYDDNEQEHGMQRSTLLTNPAMQMNVF